MPTPEAARSKAWDCRRKLAGIAGSNPDGEWISLVNVVCRQVEVCSTGWSLDQRSPTECGASECDRGTSIMKRPCPTSSCRATKKKSYYLIHISFEQMSAWGKHAFIMTDNEDKIHVDVMFNTYWFMRDCNFSCVDPHKVNCLIVMWRKRDVTFVLWRHVRVNLPSLSSWH
jgi:hypothetical protein